jgi:hypothetical protein
MQAELESHIAHRDGTAFPAADESQLASLVRRAKLSLGAELPEDFLDFLKRSNGAVVDGVVLYPTDAISTSGFDVPGLIDINLRRREYREGLEGLIIIGEADDDYLVYRPLDRTYLRIDRMALDPYDTAPSLTSLVNGTFSRRG